MDIIGGEEIGASAGVIRSGKLFHYGHADQCSTFEQRYAEFGRFPIPRLDFSESRRLKQLQKQ